MQFTNDKKTVRTVT